MLLSIDACFLFSAANAKPRDVRNQNGAPATPVPRPLSATEKRRQQEEELRALSAAERRAELEARENQIAAIAGLMAQQPDRFGHISLAELQGQLGVYYS